jgi:hypothetical protein
MYISHGSPSTRARLRLTAGIIVLKLCAIHLPDKSAPYEAMFTPRSFNLVSLLAQVRPPPSPTLTTGRLSRSASRVLGIPNGDPDQGEFIPSVVHLALPLRVRALGGVQRDYYALAQKSR